MSERFKGRYCDKPFYLMEYHTEGKAYACCPNWQETPLGNLYENDFENVWNSEFAQNLRASIIDGSYKYCNANVCPALQSNDLLTFDELPDYIAESIHKKETAIDYKPKIIMLNNDHSCNLACPSCRKTPIMHSSTSPQYLGISRYIDEIYDRHIKDLGGDQLTLNMTGSGDPFASLAFKRLIKKIDSTLYPNLKIDLQTNGVLLTPKMWDYISNIHDNIDRIIVSIDAATKETYEQIRVGGIWELLNDNMEFLVRERAEGKFKHLQVNLIVQQKNYKELAMFAKKYIELGVDCVHYSLIIDWGTFEENNSFSKQCIYDPNHPEYNDFLKILNDKIFQHPKVSLGNLTSYYEDRRKTKNLKLFFKTLHFRDTNNLQANMKASEIFKIKAFNFMHLIYERGQRFFKDSAL